MIVDCTVMPPKQRTKAELKQLVDELTEKLRAADARLNDDVEAERDEALERADAERQSSGSWISSKRSIS